MTSYTSCLPGAVLTSGNQDFVRPSILCPGLTCQVAQSWNGTAKVWPHWQIQLAPLLMANNWNSSHSGFNHYLKPRLPRTSTLCVVKHTLSGRKKVSLSCKPLNTNSYLRDGLEQILQKLIPSFEVKEVKKLLLLGQAVDMTGGSSMRGRQRNTFPYLKGTVTVQERPQWQTLPPTVEALRKRGMEDVRGCCVNYFPDPASLHPSVLPIKHAHFNTGKNYLYVCFFHQPGTLCKIIQRMNTFCSCQMWSGVRSTPATNKFYQLHRNALFYFRVT